jgi:hypothetical protein
MPIRVQHRRRAYVAACCLLTVAILVIASAGMLAADDNPFSRMALEAFVGRFSSTNVEMRFKLEGDGLAGTILYRGKTYTAKATPLGDGIGGEFGDGQQSWPFSATSDGRELAFKAGTFARTLTRMPPPKLDGIYASEKVWLRLNAEGTRYTGTLRFQGQEYAVAAHAFADEIEGAFSREDKSYPFRISQEPSGLKFQTGLFRDTIALQPKTCLLKVEVNPPGVFKLYAGTEELRGTNNQFQLPAERPIDLMAQAQGYSPVRLRRTLPAYGEETWKIDWVKPPKLWENSLGMKFVPVPGTRVWFCIWETRVRDYQMFVKATGREWPKASFEQASNHPAVNVTWDDAQAFCQWLSQVEHSSGVVKSEQQYRLPLDTEWSLAAALTDEKGDTPAARDGMVKDNYPWGSQWPPPNRVGNYDDFSNAAIPQFSDGFRNTAPAGSLEPNALGVYDLGGNVWEWCEDWYDADQKYRVLRGASWCDHSPAYLLTSRRVRSQPNERFDFNGFRVVLTTSESQP